MADILPKYNPGETAPNWTGASQKPDASTYRADKSLETLFSGVGDLIGQATATGYNAITNKVKDKWNSVFEPTRDAQGVGDVTQAAPVGLEQPGAGLSASGKPVGGIPAAATESMAEKAQKLTAAHGDGRISNQYYYSQLSALTRQMKAQFPGFGEEVDAVVQKTTGIVPANALRNAILETLDGNKAKADKQRENEEKERKELFQKYGSPAQMSKFQQTGQMPTLEEMRAHAYPQIAQEHRVTAVKAELELAAKNRDDTSERGLQAATAEVTGMTERIFKDSLETLGGENSAMAQALKSGKPIEGAQRDQLLGQFQAFKTAYEQRIRNVYERGYGQYINDPSKIDQAVRMHMGRVESIERALGAGDFTLAAMNAKMLKGSQDENTRRLYNSSAAIRAVDSLSGLNGGKEAMAIIMNNPNMGVLKDTVRATLELFSAQSAAGTNTSEGKSNLRQATEELARQHGGLNKVPAAAGKALIDVHVNLLMDPKTSDEVRANTAKDLFSDPNLVGTFGQRAEAFNRLASPAVTAQMVKLKEKDPEAYNKYVNWVKSNFQKVALLEGNKIAAVADEKYLKIEFDPTGNQFVPSLTPEGLKYAKQLSLAAGSVAGRQSMEQSSDPLQMLVRNDASIREYARTITTMNSLIKTVEPVLKGGGYEAGQEMRTLFNQWGITNRQSAPNGASFWQRLGKAILPAKEEDPNKPKMNTFGGGPLNFQMSSGDDQGTGRQTLNLTEASFGTRGKSIPDDGSKITPENWNLTFYKPNDLLAATEGGAWVDARAARMAEDLGKRFFEETGIRVGVNSPVPEGQTAGARRGTRDPNDLPAGSAGKRSQHVHGKAFDFQIQNLSDAQKKRFLEMAHETGFGGIGFYQNGHLHLDTGGMRTWGPRPSWANGLKHKEEGATGTLAGYGLGR